MLVRFLIRWPVRGNMYNEFSQYELDAINEHNKELREDEESISQAIKDFKLDTISRGELERKAARWKLEFDALEYETEEPLKTHRQNSIDFMIFWLSGKFTDKEGKPNKLGKAIKKYLSNKNTGNSKSDRPRAGAVKPTKDELEVFRAKYQEKRESEGVTGDYGWLKAAGSNFGYSVRQISRIFNKK
jgi:hypothetical protein